MNAPTSKYLRVSHRRVNHLLSLTVIALSLYILSAPFMPQLTWLISGRNNFSSAEQSSKAGGATNKAPISNDEMLIVPRLDMKQDIHTGAAQTELRKGAWLLPGTSTPDKGSNTVIVGHRFTYAGPAVFYYLDKLKLQDNIYVQWKGKEYAYSVNSISTVPPTAVSVEEPTVKTQLTLYTCTPLWSAKNRLVITAQLEGIRE